MSICTSLQCNVKLKRSFLPVSVYLHSCVSLALQCSCCVHLLDSHTVHPLIKHTSGTIHTQLPCTGSCGAKVQTVSTLPAGKEDGDTQESALSCVTLLHLFHLFVVKFKCSCVICWCHFLLQRSWLLWQMKGCSKCCVLHLIKIKRSRRSKIHHHRSVSQRYDL